MIKKIVLFIIIGLITFLGITPANAKEKIFWIYLDFPPMFISKGSFSHQGNIDWMIKFLSEKLDDYDHDIIKCNIARANALLKAKKHVIQPVSLKTPEREKYIDFSIPAYVLLPNGVIIQKRQLGEFKPYLNDNGELSLEKALTKSVLRLGIVKERAYGGNIDEILLKYKNHKNINVIAGANLSEDLIKMMLGGRLDYVISSPYEGKYIGREIGEDKNLTFIPVEGMPEYILGYIGFPKTAWGNTLKQKINAILRQYRNKPEFSAVYEFWLDKNSIERHRKYTEKVFGTLSDKEHP